jgi:hypothetical protein
MAIDSTVNNSFLGWNPPKYFSKRAWTKEGSPVVGVSGGEREMPTVSRVTLDKKDLRKAKAKAEIKVAEAVKEKVKSKIRVKVQEDLKEKIDAAVGTRSVPPGKVDMVRPEDFPSYEMAPVSDLGIGTGYRAMFEATLNPDMDALLFPGPGSIFFEWPMATAKVPGFARADMSQRYSAYPSIQNTAKVLERKLDKLSIPEGKKRQIRRQINRRIKAVVKESAGLSGYPSAGETDLPLQEATGHASIGVLTYASPGEERFFDSLGDAESSRNVFEDMPVGGVGSRKNRKQVIRRRRKAIISRRLGMKLGLVDQAAAGLLGRGESVASKILVSTDSGRVPSPNTDMVVEMSVIRTRMNDIRKIISEDIAKEVTADVQAGRIPPTQARSEIKRRSARAVKAAIEPGEAGLIASDDFSKYSSSDMVDALPEESILEMNGMGQNVPASSPSTGVTSWGSFWSGIGTSVVGGLQNIIQGQTQAELLKAQTKLEAERAKAAAYAAAAATPGTGLHKAQQMQNALLIGGGAIALIAVIMAMGKR